MGDAESYRKCDSPSQGYMREDIPVVKLVQRRRHGLRRDIQSMHENKDKSKVDMAIDMPTLTPNELT